MFVPVLLHQRVEHLALVSNSARHKYILRAVDFHGDLIEPPATPW